MEGGAAHLEQWERVKVMEESCNQASAALKALEAALSQVQAALPALRALDAYLGSPAWHQDRADDEAGAFPPQLRRGVLSEDTIYDLLTQYRQLREQALSLPEEL